MGAFSIFIIAHRGILTNRKLIFSKEYAMVWETMEGEAKPMPVQLDLVTYANVFHAIMRYGAPIMAGLLLLRCAWPLLTHRREPEIWAWLVLRNGERLPITHWENVIGRSGRCDIVVQFPTVSRNHAVLTRYDDGSWSISDADSKDGTLLNGDLVDISPIFQGDVIEIGGVELQFLPITAQQEKTMAKLRSKAATSIHCIGDLLLLSLFQICGCLGFLLGGTAYQTEILTGWIGLLVLEWMLLVFYLVIRRPAFEVETLAFFLCTMGMAVISTVAPKETVKQLAAIVLGLLAFLAVGWSMRDLERAKIIRYLAAVGGALLLVVTLVFGESYYGAKNWLVIGGISLQPSELAKVCFVYVGASTMDRLMKKRNIILFIAYTIMLCGFLTLMNDFGTALIFFFAFLVIAYLRSGSVGTIALACTALVFAGVIGLKIAPHALQRFETWRHIWEDPYGAGYQQTRALMCIASGGLWGLGIGKGKMKYLFAADSDVVFATVSEEWGMVTMLICVLCIVVLALFSLRSAKASRSSFYAIGACTASAILLVQTIFNVLGTVDVLPLTGVTFPFLSNGGSSMICVWGLLAFIKAADTRQNASFAVKLPGRRNGDE